MYINFCTAYGFLNHASDTNIHGAMLMVSGDPTPLNPKYHDLYQWFVAGIPRKHYSIDLSQWRKRKLSGLVLTTTEMIEWQWEKKLKPAMIKLQEEDAKKGNLNKWDDSKYCNDKMTELATSNETVINKDPLTLWKYNLLTEMMHAYHNYMSRQVLTSVYTLIQELQNKRLVMKCLGKTNLRWFICDARKYLLDVSMKKIDLKWNFNATGPKWRELCDVMYYVWIAAAWIEHYRIEKILGKFDINDIKNNLNCVDFNWEIFVATLKYSVKYVSHKHLRRAYASMFKQTVEVVPPSQIPNTIKCMMHHYRNGYNIQCRCDTQMVCLMCINIVS